MKYKVEVEDGIYYVDAYYVNTLDNSCSLFGTVILDSKRNTYYLIPHETQKNDIWKQFISIMENLFITSLAPRVDDFLVLKRGSRTGKLSKNFKDIIPNLFEKLDIQMPQDKEELNDNKYQEQLKLYVKGYYPERKMFNNEDN